MQSIAEARALLRELLAGARERELLRQRAEAGELDEADLDRRLDELDRAVEPSRQRFDRATIRLSEQLPHPHAVALLRYVQSRRLTRNYDDGFLLHAHERALEELGISLGIPVARWLRERREPVREETEEVWLENARDRSDLVKDFLELTARAIAQPNLRDLVPWLDPALRFVGGLGEDDHALPALRGPCREATRTMVALAGGEMPRHEALARLQDAIAWLDAGTAIRLVPGEADDGSAAANVDPTDEARALLRPILDAERALELARARCEAGEIDGEDVDRHIAENEASVDAADVRLERASLRLIETLPDPHAILLLRYLESRRLSFRFGDGFLIHAHARALEELGMSLGLPVAQWLRARREPQRASLEELWVANACDRPGGLRDFLMDLERTTLAIAEPNVRDLVPWLDPTRRFAALLARKDRGLPPAVRESWHAAARTLSALVDGEVRRFEAHEQLRAVVLALDSALALRSAERRPT